MTEYLRISKKFARRKSKRLIRHRHAARHVAWVERKRNPGSDTPRPPKGPGFRRRRSTQATYLCGLRTHQIKVSAYDFPPLQEGEARYGKGPTDLFPAKRMHCIFAPRRAFDHSLYPLPFKGRARVGMGFTPTRHNPSPSRLPPRFALPLYALGVLKGEENISPSLK